MFAYLLRSRICPKVTLQCSETAKRPRDASQTLQASKFRTIQLGGERLSRYDLFSLFVNMEAWIMFTKLVEPTARL